MYDKGAAVLKNACSEPAAEVVPKTHKVLMHYVAKKSSVGARNALLETPELTPKSGLADLANSGAHPDIDYDLFCNSAKALVPFFEHAVLIDFNGGDFALLEEAGKAAKSKMLATIGGKNTHKGTIFHM